MKLLQLNFKILYFVYFVGLYFFVLVDSGYYVLEYYMHEHDKEPLKIHPDDLIENGLVFGSESELKIYI